MAMFGLNYLCGHEIFCGVGVWTDGIFSTIQHSTFYFVVSLVSKGWVLSCAGSPCTTTRGTHVSESDFLAVGVLHYFTHLRHLLSVSCSVAEHLLKEHCAIWSRSHLKLFPLPQAQLQQLLNHLISFYPLTRHIAAKALPTISSGAVPPPSWKCKPDPIRELVSGTIKRVEIYVNKLNPAFWLLEVDNHVYMA